MYAVFFYWLPVLNLYKQLHKFLFLLVVKTIPRLEDRQERSKKSLNIHVIMAGFFIQKEDGVIEIVVEDATNKGRLGEVKIC